MLNNEMRWVYGIHAVWHLLHSTPKKVATVYVTETRQDRRIQEIITLAQENSLTLHFASKDKLTELVQSNPHQGVVALLKEATGSAKPNNENSLTELLNDLESKSIAPFLVLLDGVQDPHNLGAILRTANAAGVHAVIVPKDNAVQMTPVVKKVASGAAEHTPLITVTNLARTMRALKERGIWIYGTADEASENIFEQKLAPPIALVFGAEGEGLRRLTRESCDALVKIPLRGEVSSLNVSVAAGICLFAVQLK